jgi:hypothetical protein
MLVASLRFWLDNLDIMLHWFTHVVEYFIGYYLDHCINWNMENHPGKQCNHNTTWLWS